jgi:RNA polymerase sigma-70 factor (ECF subfamily)
MRYASTLVRSDGLTTIPLCVRYAENDQVPIGAEHHHRRQDGVLTAVALGIRNQLRSAASNENVAPVAGIAGHNTNGVLGRARARRADPDSDILALIDTGDDDGAIRQLIQRHGAAVRRYCRDALRDAALAEDVHQQVFIEAFRDLRRFQRRATVKVWLLAIARHRVLDAVKKRRSARNYFADGGAAAADAFDAAPTPGECLDEARLLAALLASLDELPDGSRTAVLLHYEHGLTFAEIAKICRERSGTLCARVARALPVLRRRIEARLASPL